MYNIEKDDNYMQVKNNETDDKQILTPEFVTILEKARIVPWKTFVDLNEFRIERERLGDIEMHDTLRLIQKFGICHLRLSGQSPDENTLRNYFESIGQVMQGQNDFPGEIKNITPSPDIQANTGDSSGDLGFHVDGTQHEDQPALVAFQYSVTADQGGNSRFADVAKILLDLPTEVKEQVLVNLSQRDTAIFEKKGMKLESPIFHFPDGETLACRIRIDDVINVKESCKKDFEILKGILLSNNYEIKFKPRSGDIIIFDNWRILHARDTVLGNAQRHHRRVWMEALLPRHQPFYHLGIRPIPSGIKAKMMA